MADVQLDFFGWYSRLPPITKGVLTGAVGLTVACSLDILNPYALYFNYDLIFNNLQVR